MKYLNARSKKRSLFPLLLLIFILLIFQFSYFFQLISNTQTGIDNIPVTKLPFYYTSSQDYEMIELWNFSTVPLLVRVKTGDVNNDGKDEVLLSQNTAVLSSLTLINNSGGIIWTKNFTAINKHVSAFEFAELDGDPEKEIIYGFSDSNPGGDDNIFAINHDGSYIWNQSNKGGIQAKSIGVGDIDLDNLDEVVVGDNLPQIRLYDHNGTFLWNESFPATVGYTLISDITGDGKGDILLDTRAPDGKIYTYDPNHTPLWNESPPGNSDYITTGELTGDGINDVIWQARLPENFYVYQNNGTLLWNKTPWIRAESFCEIGIAAIVDIMGDSDNELIAVNDTNIIVFNSTGSPLWKFGSGWPIFSDFFGNQDSDFIIVNQSEIYIINRTGSIEATLNLTNNMSVFTGWFPVTSADVDGDFKDEIVYLSEDSEIICLKLNYFLAWDWTMTEVVSTESTADSWDPVITMNGSGHVHVAWWDETNYSGSGEDDDIFYKRWNATIGTWPLTEVVSTESTSDSRHPTITVDGSGDLHIVWDDYTSGTDWDIFYKRWNATTGNWTTTEVVSTESTSNSNNPAIMVDAAGHVHVIWHDLTNYSDAGTDYDIFYKRWNATTGIWTTTEVVSTESTEHSMYPTIIIDDSGHIHAVWHDWTDYDGADADDDIFYKRWNATTGNWTITEVVSTESPADSAYPTIAVDGAKNIHVTWWDNTDYSGAGIDQDIFYKCWNATTGNWITTEVVSTESTNTSSDPTIAADESGHLYVVWHDLTNYSDAGTDYDIFYKRWNVTTGNWTTTEVVSTESTEDSKNPTIEVDNNGYVHVAWTDGTDYNNAGTDYDIFYKKFFEMKEDKFIEAPKNLQVTPPGWTNNNLFNVSWVNPNDPSGIIGAYYKLDVTPTSSTNGIYVAGDDISSITSISVSGQGNHTIYVWLKDRVLNIDHTKYASTVLYYDSSIAAPVGLAADPSGWTNIDSFNVNWTNPADFSGITGAYYKLDSAPLSDTNGTYVAGDNISSIPGISVSGQGNHTIYVWLVDALGNIHYLNWSSVSVYYDSSIAAPVGLAADPSGWTNIDSFNANWTNPADFSGIIGAYYKLDSAPLSDTNGTYVVGDNISSIPGISVSGQGNHTIYVWLVDAVGNINYLNWSSVSVYYDSSIAAPIGLAADPSSWTNIDSFDLGWTNPGDISGLTGKYFKLDMPPSNNTDGTYIAGSSNFLSAFSVTTEGAHSFYLWLVDSAGNINYLNRAEIVLYFDNAPPFNFTIISPIEEIGDATPEVICRILVSGAGISLSSVQYAYSTNGSLTPINWASVDGVYLDAACKIDASEGAIGPLYVKVNAVPFNQFSLTNNTIRFRASDIANNPGIQSIASIIPTTPTEEDGFNILILIIIIVAIVGAASMSYIVIRKRRPELIFAKDKIKQPIPSTVSPPAPLPRPEELVEVKREYDYVGGNIRFKIAVRNNSQTMISKIQVTLTPTDQFKYETEVKSVETLGPGESRGVDYILTPITCGKSQVFGTVSYIDAFGTPASITIPTKEIWIKCPLVTSVKADAKDLLQWRTQLQNGITTISFKKLTREAAFEIVSNQISALDLAVVTINEYFLKATYSGIAKVTNTKIIVEIETYEDTIGIIVWASDLKQVTGFLAYITNLVNIALDMSKNLKMKEEKIGQQILSAFEFTERLIQLFEYCESNWALSEVINLVKEISRRIQRDLPSIHLDMSQWITKLDQKFKPDATLTKQSAINLEYDTLTILEKVSDLIRSNLKMYESTFQYETETIQIIEEKHLKLLLTKIELEKLYSKRIITLLLVIEKDSGVTLYRYNFSEKELDPDLISGFLTAIQGFSAEFTTETAAIKKLAYQNFEIELNTGDYIRAALVLSGQCSKFLVKTLIKFIDSFEQTYEESLKTMPVDLTKFEDASQLVFLYFLA